MEMNEELDDEFDQCLVNMKPYVLRLSAKSERQRCANWIKKLCEPPGTGHNARKNRNSYALLLHHMLQRGLIEGPFANKPQPVPLATLPAHTSIYFDEPRDVSFPAMAESGGKTLPDWVYGELSDNAPNSTSRPTAASMLRERYQGTAGSWPHRRSRTENGVQTASAAGDKEFRSQRDTHEEMFVYDSSDVSPTKTSFRANSSLKEGTMTRKQHEKELEMRTKMLEAHHHELKLQLQQRHDEAIQKILDRKNSEMEEMKSHYRSKSKETDATIRKLERKVQSLAKESALIRDSRDLQIAELKKMVEHSSQSTQNEYETKLHGRTAEFEQEKFEMQKQHTKAIQEILDDTNARLHKMETEYSEQVNQHAEVIRGLEARVMQISRDSEEHSIARAEEGREREELERRNKLLSVELENIRTRYADIEKAAEQARDGHEMEMRSMRNKTDASIEFMKTEHSLSLSKSADTIRELEQHVQDLKQQLQDSDHGRQRELRDLESMLKQDKLRQDALHEKQLMGLRSEMEAERQGSHSKMLKLQQAIRDKDEQLEKSAELRKTQSQQAEKALAEFKQQAERNSGRMFEDMKVQMEKVGADLLQSKELRQTQTKEYVRQLEQERKRSQKQLSDQETSHVEKVARLVQQQQMERESMQQEHERILAVATDRLQGRMDEEHRQSLERQDRDTATIRELEQQVRDLREASLQSESLRKQQLVELGLLRDEEKQRAQRENQNAVSTLKSEMEQQRLRLQKDHSAEMERMLQETNTRLKDIEIDYSERLTKAAENTRQLEDGLETLRRESHSRRSDLERQMTDAIAKLEDENKLLKKQHAAYLKTLHGDLDEQRIRARQVERELQQRDFHHQDQMTHLKQDYESRLRGLMPLGVRQELEDTIDALKSQVTSLQQTSNLLQEEMDINRKHSSNVRSPSRK